MNAYSNEINGLPSWDQVKSLINDNCPGILTFQTFQQNEINRKIAQRVRDIFSVIAIFSGVSLGFGLKKSAILISVLSGLISLISTVAALYFYNIEQRISRHLPSSEKKQEIACEELLNLLDSDDRSICDIVDACININQVMKNDYFQAVITRSGHAMLKTNHSIKIDPNFLEKANRKDIVISSLNLTTLSRKNRDILLFSYLERVLSSSEVSADLINAQIQEIHPPLLVAWDGVSIQPTPLRLMIQSYRFDQDDLIMACKKLAALVPIEIVVATSLPSRNLQPSGVNHDHPLSKEEQDKYKELEANYPNITLTWR